MDFEQLADIKNKMRKVNSRLKLISSALDTANKLLIPQHYEIIKRIIQRFTKAVKLYSNFTDSLTVFVGIGVLANPQSADKKIFDAITENIKQLASAMTPELNEIGSYVDNIKVGQKPIKDLVGYQMSYELISTFADYESGDALRNLASEVSLVRDKILYTIKMYKKADSHLVELVEILKDLGELFTPLFEERDRVITSIMEKYEKQVKELTSDEHLIRDVNKYFNDRIKGIINPLSNYIKTLDAGSELMRKFTRILEGEYIRDTLEMEKIFGSDIRVKINALIEKCKSKSGQIINFVGDEDYYSNEYYRKIGESPQPSDYPKETHREDIVGAASRYRDQKKQQNPEYRRRTWSRLYGQAKAAEIYAYMLMLLIGSKCNFDAEYGSSEGEGETNYCTVFPPIDIWFWHDRSATWDVDSNGNEQCYLKLGTKTERRDARYVIE